MLGQGAALQRSPELTQPTPFPTRDTHPWCCIPQPGQILLRPRVHLVQKHRGQDAVRAPCQPRRFRRVALRIQKRSVLAASTPLKLGACVLACTAHPPDKTPCRAANRRLTCWCLLQQRQASAISRVLKRRHTKNSPSLIANPNRPRAPSSKVSSRGGAAAHRGALPLSLCSRAVHVARAP